MKNGKEAFPQNYECANSPVLKKYNRELLHKKKTNKKRVPNSK